MDKVMALVLISIAIIQLIIFTKVKAANKNGDEKRALALDKKSRALNFIGFTLFGYI